MATLKEKLFLAVIILIIGGGVIYWAYKYDEKLRHDGVGAKKAALYVIGGIVLLVGVAGLQGIAYRNGDIFGWLMFDDLFRTILDFAF